MITAGKAKELCNVSLAANSKAIRESDCFKALLRVTEQNILNAIKIGATRVKFTVCDGTLRYGHHKSFALDNIQIVHEFMKYMEELGYDIVPYWTTGTLEDIYNINIDW